VELIIFIGLQGAGKSTFYRQRFADTHLRLNLDMLKTRHRENILFTACLETRQPVVVDNTNPTPADRARYIGPAQAHGFRIVGYYFQSRLADCQRRNEQRPPAQVIPPPGLRGTLARLVRPRREEGFDALYYARIADSGKFVVEDWQDEIC